MGLLFKINKFGDFSHYLQSFAALRVGRNGNKVNADVTYNHNK